MFLLKDPIQIIAVSYHRARDFELCISSILSNTTIPYQLVVIDNSVGALDNLLVKYDLNVIRNQYNLGKGRSFQFWYKHIMHSNNNPYFVSLDADVVVPPGWLESLMRSARHAPFPLGAIAPAFVKTTEDLNKEDPYSGMPYMHGLGYSTGKDIFYTTKTAGPLLLIDRGFYEGFGGYPGDCLYGHDDGFICKMAAKNKRFIGYTTSVKCVHSNIDNTDEYTQWKFDNINKTNASGYWDIT